MSLTRVGSVAALAALIVLLAGGSVATGGADATAPDLASALLTADDLPSDLDPGLGVTHEPAFDYDQASFEASGGLDKVAQTWQSTNVVQGNPFLFVFDFRFLFPSAEAAAAYLDAAEPILSESVTGITLQPDTPTVGEDLRHYAGSLSQGDVTLEMQNFLIRSGPVVAKVFVGGFGTTVDDALPIAEAAAARIDAWLEELPASSPVPSAAASPVASPSGSASPGASTTPVDGALRQWAVAATASSAYGPDAFSATQATGAPDVTAYADDSHAWAPSSSEGTVEWLELTYEQAVVPTAVGIVESFASGAVTMIEAFDADQEAWVELWSGEDPSPLELVTFSPPLAPVSFATDRIRITIDTGRVAGWEEIDAVELVGTVP